jgi:hypothetical protein
LHKKKCITIGNLVAPEWAKSKGYRVINTHHLSVWGNTINQSIVENEQLEILDQILTDINALLDRKIKPADITPDRYYQLDTFGEDFD